jgi:uncharacterized protein YqgV (UPF0045/DUF77 family)
VLITSKFKIKTLINASFDTSIAVLSSNTEAAITRAGKRCGIYLVIDNSASQVAEKDEYK